jgi:hypothetical protein
MSELGGYRWVSFQHTAVHRLLRVFFQHVLEQHLLGFSIGFSGKAFPTDVANHRLSTANVESLFVGQREIGVTPENDQRITVCRYLFADLNSWLRVLESTVKARLWAIIECVLAEKKGDC